MRDLDTDDPATIAAAAAHLDDFRAHDLGGELEITDDVVTPDSEPDEGDDGGTDIAMGEVMSHDEFYIMFEGLFAAPMMLATMVPNLDPEPFQLVAVQPDEAPAARKASDAAYRLAERYYPALLDAKTGPLWDALAVGGFVLMKVMLIKAILAMQKAQVDAPPAEQQPVADGKEPEFKSQRSPLQWMDAEGSA